ncbi:phosphopantetheine-binding protein [Streptomyces coacervatus]|uniref:acyl carrier protein n=1 Tax=Streptomyces coacervatus TaxID=647381 RepID=UPI0023DC3370|nr:phosphopantetheine-binding protein [Streptomyces coacervatus]MDF2265146.1 phosphopantetheine-binding protein [Streptomyces coacervatus]
MTPTYQHLAALLTQKFDVPPDELRPEATYDELGLDSLAVVELFVTLQEHWDIPLDESEAVGTLSVLDTAQLVDSKRQAA